jgi:type IV secretion system protein VirB2
VSPSLFDASESLVMTEAVSWLAGTLLGSVATASCVIAIALVGLMMLGGRLAAREGVRVVIGCFVLLGAPAIAAAFQAFGGGIEIRSPEAGPVSKPTPRTRAELPPSSHDPYAGASLRTD